MKLHLKIWRQESAQAQGRLADYDLDGVSPDSSFLEMLDLLNEELIEKGEEPVAFDHDCREGICGMCSLVINGVAHGQDREHIKQITVCQLHMRHFHDGEIITIEPWRAHAFPILKDLIIDRTAFDRIIQAGGYVALDVAVDLNGLEAEDVFVECVMSDNGINHEEALCSVPLFLTGATGEGEALYHCDLFDEDSCSIGGLQHFRIRIYPCHPLLSHPLECGLMLWL